MSKPAPEQQANPATEAKPTSIDTGIPNVNGHFKLDRTQIIWLVIIGVTGIAVLAIVLWLLFRYTCTPTARAKGLQVRDGRDCPDDDPEAASMSGTSRDAESIKLQNSSSFNSLDKSGLGSSSFVQSSSPVGPIRSNSRRVLNPYSQQPSYITHDNTPARSQSADTYPASILSPRVASPDSHSPSPPPQAPRSTPAPSRAQNPPRAHNNWPLAPPSPIRPLSSCPPSPRLQSPRIASPPSTLGRIAAVPEIDEDRARGVIPPVSTGEEFASSLGLGLGFGRDGRSVVDGGRESPGEGTRNRYYSAQIWG